MDVKLLHSLQEENVSEQPGEYSYLSDSGSIAIEQPVFPFILYLITVVYLGTGIVATLASWGGTAFFPGADMCNRAMLEINVLALPTVLPLGIYAPFLAFVGYNLVKKKQSGLSMLAFAFGLSISSAFFLAIKFPTYFSTITTGKEAALLIYHYQYGRFVIYFLLYVYLMAEGVQSFFGVSRKETLRICLLGLIISFTVTGLVTCFSTSIFGWNSVNAGYVNSRWFR